jgi:hypothetical protein
MFVGRTLRDDGAGEANGLEAVLNKAVGVVLILGSVAVVFLTILAAVERTLYEIAKHKKRGMGFEEDEDDYTIASLTYKLIGSLKR